LIYYAAKPFNLADDGAGGGEEEILGEGVRLRVPVRLVRVPAR
jgi:hypothetical protein